MANNKWIVTDYLQHMCEYVTLGLVSVINEPLEDPIQFTNWTFQFVFCDNKHEYRNIPVYVDWGNRTVVMNMQQELYSENPIVDMAKGIIRSFYNGSDSDPVGYLFSGDNDIPDAWHLLWESGLVFKNEGIAVVDTEVSYSQKQLETSKGTMKSLMEACDVLADAIDFDI